MVERWLAVERASLGLDLWALDMALSDIEFASSNSARCTVETWVVTVYSSGVVGIATMRFSMD